MTEYPSLPVSDGNESETNYVPLDGRAWRHSMGLRPLDPSQWFEFGPDANEQLALKSTLLESHHHDVVALREEADVASVELLDAVLDNLANEHPGRAHGLIANEHPLVSAARLVPEDLCVLVRGEDAWRLVGACVCFPSRWSLASKIGTSLDQIHDPVPGYEEALAGPTNALFDRMTPERSFWRLNWTLLDNPDLFQPVGIRSTLADDPDQWRFRVERQTLRVLPRSGAIIFTIRTYVRPARMLVDSVAGFARDVATVLESAPMETLTYKGWRQLAEKWTRWFPPNNSDPTGTPPH